MQVNLTSVSAVADSDYYVENSEWQLTGLSVDPRFYLYEGGGYQRFVVFFHLKVGILYLVVATRALRLATSI